MPCCIGLLLGCGHGVARRYPLATRLKHRVSEVQPVRVKPGPGSKTPGIGIATDEDRNRPRFSAGLNSPGGRQIGEAHTAHRAFRRRCRGACRLYPLRRRSNRFPLSASADRGHRERLKQVHVRLPMEQA